MASYIYRSFPSLNLKTYLDQGLAGLLRMVLNFHIWPWLSSPYACLKISDLNRKFSKTNLKIPKQPDEPENKAMLTSKAGAGDVIEAVHKLSGQLSTSHNIYGSPLPLTIP